MSKTTSPYWNSLQSESWTPIEDLDAEQLTLSIDPDTGEYTRLTRFLPGADSREMGAQCHDYPEEIFVVSGQLYDAAFDLWLSQGYYASRAPGEVHGPFKTDVGCVVLEISFPKRVSR